MLTEFSGNLAQSLQFGHALEIVAKTIDGASRFYIDLCTQKTSVNPTCDIGLRLQYYFHQNVLVRNTRRNNQWDNEERNRLADDTSPKLISAGDFFIIYILASEERFHISINSQPVCTFQYRLPLSSLRTVEIREQIQVIKQVDHRACFPSPWPAIHASDFFKAFSNDIPILFSPGHVIIITGRCFENKKGQFIIKFMETFTKREEFHFSVRFDQKVVVRNAMNKSFEFGTEERHGGFPFVFNQQFKLAIAFTEREILTAVDGFNFCSFSFRTPNALKNLVGFKITCINGLNIHINGVDHCKMNDVNCNNFESYSRYEN